MHSLSADKWKKGNAHVLKVGARDIRMKHILTVDT